MLSAQSPYVVLAAVASLTVPAAAACVIGSVLWRRMEDRLALPGVLLALLGAITARLASAAGGVGDPVFRRATVPWACGVAAVAVAWWLTGGRGERRHRRRAVAAGLGTVAVAVAVVGAASALGHPVPGTIPASAMAT